MRTDQTTDNTKIIGDFRDCDNTLVNRLGTETLTCDLINICSFCLSINSSYHVSTYNKVQPTALSTLTVKVSVV